MYEFKNMSPSLDDEENQTDTTMIHASASTSGTQNNGGPQHTHTAQSEDQPDHDNLKLREALGAILRRSRLQRPNNESFIVDSEDESEEAPLPRQGTPLEDCYYLITEFIKLMADPIRKKFSEEDWITLLDGGAEMDEYLRYLKAKQVNEDKTAFKTDKGRYLRLFNQLINCIHEARRLRSKVARKVRVEDRGGAPRPNLLPIREEQEDLPPRDLRDEILNRTPQGLRPKQRALGARTRSPNTGRHPEPQNGGRNSHVETKVRRSE